jgi:hypothetical protein
MTAVLAPGHGRHAAIALAATRGVIAISEHEFTIVLAEDVGKITEDQRLTHGPLTYADLTCRCPAGGRDCWGGMPFPPGPA